MTANFRRFPACSIAVISAAIRPVFIRATTAYRINSNEARRNSWQTGKTHQAIVESIEFPLFFSNDAIDRWLHNVDKLLRRHSRFASASEECDSLREQRLSVQISDSSACQIKLSDLVRTDPTRIGVVTLGTCPDLVGNPRYPDIAFFHFTGNYGSLQVEDCRGGISLIYLFKT